MTSHNTCSTTRNSSEGASRTTVPVRSKGGTTLAGGWSLRPPPSPPAPPACETPSSDKCSPPPPFCPLSAAGAASIGVMEANSSGASAGLPLYCCVLPLPFDIVLSPSRRETFLRRRLARLAAALPQARELVLRVRESPA